MITVADQASPWLIPNSTLASTIQPQVGARMRRNGTGSPASHPATSSLLRPTRSERRPAVRLAEAFTIPKLTINDRTAVFETRWKSCWPMSGMTVRSCPTIAPTKALMSTSRANCSQFARRPNRTTGKLDPTEALLAVTAWLRRLGPSDLTRSPLPGSGRTRRRAPVRSDRRGRRWHIPARWRSGSPADG